jgi:hypothetical protein
MRSLIKFALAAALLAPNYGTARACGFENPALIQKGMLNWIYPKSLYVDTAVWQAQQAGLLPREETLAEKKSLLVNPGYSRAVRTLKGYAGGIGAGNGSEAGSVAIMFFEAMFYARISFGPEGVGLDPHIAGPGKDEPLLITHRVVMEAIRTGKLGLDDAIAMGLIRTYGDQSRIDQAVERLRLVAFATPVADLGPTGLRR